MHNYNFKINVILLCILSFLFAIFLHLNNHCNFIQKINQANKIASINCNSHNFKQNFQLENALIKSIVSKQDLKESKNSYIGNCIFCNTEFNFMHFELNNFISKILFINHINLSASFAQISIFRDKLWFIYKSHSPS